MGIFDRFTKAAQDSYKKLDGRKDALEAVCSACALVAGHDGDISDKEVDTTINLIKNNSKLSASFDIRVIEQTADVMFERAKGGRSGRHGLWKEIDEVAKDPEIAEIVFIAALDVADQDGISDGERKVLGDIAKRLGLNPANYEL